MKATAGVQQLIGIGLQKQLLVDDFVIAQRSDLQFAQGQVTKQNNGQPILTNSAMYGSAVYDEGKFKLWWRTFPRVVTNILSPKTASILTSEWN